jgi:hypothetical protein
MSNQSVFGPDGCHAIMGFVSRLGQSLKDDVSARLGVFALQFSTDQRTTFFC